MVFIPPEFLRYLRRTSRYSRRTSGRGEISVPSFLRYGFGISPLPEVRPAWRGVMRAHGRPPNFLPFLRYGFRFPCFLRHGFGNVPTSLRYARHTSRYAGRTSGSMEKPYLRKLGKNPYLRKREKTIPQEACQKPYLRKHGKTIPPNNSAPLFKMLSLD